MGPISTLLPCPIAAFVPLQGQGVEGGYGRWPTPTITLQPQWDPTGDRLRAYVHPFSCGQSDNGAGD